MHSSEARTSLPQIAGVEWPLLNLVIDGFGSIVDTDCRVESELLHLDRTFCSVVPQIPGSFLKVRVRATCLVCFGRGQSVECRHPYDAPPFQQECVRRNAIDHTLDRFEMFELILHAPLACCYTYRVTSMRWCRTRTIRIPLSLYM